MVLNKAAPRFLSAETSVELADPNRIVDAFHSHFASHLEMVREPGSLRFSGDFGSGTITTEGARFSVKLNCVDENTLVAVKSMVAEHLIEFTGDKSLDFSWQGDGAGQRNIRNLHEMRVVRGYNITPRMRRLVLRCDNIGPLMTGGLHIRLLLPPKGRTPVWPTLAANGSFSWPTGDDTLEVRVYTIRRGFADRNEIEVDFVMHDGDNMPGANFGANAVEGDLIGVIGPGGGVAPDCERYVLAGDETALPVISRIVEEMPAGRKVTVFMEIADAAEQQQIASQADVDWHWLHRDGKVVGTAGLIEQALDAFDFGDDHSNLHVFAGCEKNEARSIKTLLVEGKGLPKGSLRAVGYWMIGEDDGHDH